VAFGAAYLATRKSEDKKLSQGPPIAPAAANSDPEETKFIEYGMSHENAYDRQFLKDAEKEGRKPAAAGHH
jgi:hypothetical protein